LKSKFHYLFMIITKYVNALNGNCHNFIKSDYIQKYNKHNFIDNSNTPILTHIRPIWNLIFNIFDLRD